VEWVDFQEIKQKVSLRDVLAHYQLLSSLKPRGDELVGLCPFCQQDYYPTSFSANTRKNIFHCFACGVKGNVLDFVCQKEKVSIREAGLSLQDWFLKEKPPVSPQESLNPPLTFQLKKLKKDHPYLKERGLKKETIEEFGLGYCQRGLMKGRIVIPIYDERGQLVAYAGRYPASQVPQGESKYLFPPNFKKNLLLYNLQRAKDFSQEEGLILVEGFFEVFDLWQKGVKNVVSLMGISLSPEQEKLLLSHCQKVTLMLDDDQAGRKATKEITDRLINKVFLKIGKI
jgi:DNA primase